MRQRVGMRAGMGAGALACVAVVAGTALAQGHDDPKVRGRLVVADHQKPVVRVFDLDTGEVTQSFDMPKPNAGFAVAEDGRHIVIKTGDDLGTLRLLDSGLVTESHGDHDALAKGEVKLLPFAVMGHKPAHVVSENGWLALFYDGHRPWERESDPKAVLLDLKSLTTTQPTIDVWQSPAPQHGIAVPLGRKQFLMSLPNPAYAKADDKTASSRPNGFEIVERNAKGWKTVASFNDMSKTNSSCKAYHGHASSKNVHAFGCNEGADGGILVIGKQGANWTARKLAYPDERRTSTLKAREGGRYMIGNYGLKSPYDALLRVDVTAKSLSAADVLPLGQAACQFELAGDGKRVVNLTPDGRLRVYDVANGWKELANFEAVPAFDCAYDAKTPASALAVIGDSAFVSDPTNARIREFHLDTLKQGIDLPIDGVPTNIAGGGSGG